MQKVYSQILQIAGDVITVEAKDVGYKELAEIRTKAGISLAQVIRLQDDKVSLQVLAGSRGISTNDQVRFLRRPVQVSCSENLLGRTFTGNGDPRDNGPALTDNMINIGGPPVNPAKRIIPKNMIRTGIPMIRGGAFRSINTPCLLKSAVFAALVRTLMAVFTQRTKSVIL